MCLKYLDITRTHMIGFVTRSRNTSYFTSDATLSYLSPLQQEPSHKNALRYLISWVLQCVAVFQCCCVKVCRSALQLSHNVSLITCVTPLFYNSFPTSKDHSTKTPCVISHHSCCSIALRSCSALQLSHYKSHSVRDMAHS